MAFWSSRKSDPLANGGDFELINSSKEFQKEMSALWSNIRKNVSDDSLPGTFALCSASAGEGCTTITLGLGMFASKHSHKKVVLVDTQLENLYLTDFLSYNYPELLMEENSGYQNVGFREYRLATRNLRFIQITNPEILHYSEENESSFDTFLMFLRNSYEYIFFDCPPVLSSPVPNFLAEKLDYVIFVVSAARLNQRRLVTAINNVSSDKEKLLGVVMNKRQNVLPRFINRLIS